MNRADKRNLLKKLKKANKKMNLGFNTTQMKEYVKIKELQSKNPILEEGQKVKINYTAITSRIDYDERREEYKNFVEENKDKVFTVKYDEKYRKNPWLVSLEEDTTNPRWLFTTSDLVIYNNEEKEGI